MTILVQQQMTEADRKQLREICDKATQGDWWIDSHGHRMVSRPRFDTVFEASSSMGPAVRHPETGNLSHWPNDWDATYIVAAQPKVVRGLLDELDQLKAENTGLHQDVASLNKENDDQLLIVEKLVAENVRLIEGLLRIVVATRLGDAAFSIAGELIGELDAHIEAKELQP